MFLYPPALWFGGTLGQSVVATRADLFLVLPLHLCYNQIKEGGEWMLDRITVNSKEEADKLVEQGYAIVTIANWVTGDGASYTLERGSEWSKGLDSK